MNAEGVVNSDVTVVGRADIGKLCHCKARAGVIELDGELLCQSCYLKTVTPNRDIMPLDRLEKSIAFVLDQLVDMAWSYMAGDELDKMSRELRKVYNKEPGKLAIAKEVYVLHCLFEIMHQVAVPGMEVCRDMLESLKTESVPKSRKLTLPNSRRMQLRRTIVKGLFNALRPKIDGERVDLKLGEALFASDDDSPRIN